jgi:hypothetical protein
MQHGQRPWFRLYTGSDSTQYYFVLWRVCSSHASVGLNTHSTRSQTLGKNDANGRALCVDSPAPGVTTTVCNLLRLRELCSKDWLCPACRRSCTCAVLLATSRPDATTFAQSTNHTRFVKYHPTRIYQHFAHG